MIETPQGLEWIDVIEDRDKCYECAHHRPKWLVDDRCAGHARDIVSGRMFDCVRVRESSNDKDKLRPTCSMWEAKPPEPARRWWQIWR